MNRVLVIASNRWTRLVLVALGLLGLQTTLLSQLRPFGVMLPVMLLFTVTAGTVHGSEVGAITGLVVGAMYDCVLTTPFGLASSASSLLLAPRFVEMLPSADQQLAAMLRRLFEDAPPEARRARAWTAHMEPFREQLGGTRGEARPAEEGL